MGNFEASTFELPFGLGSVVSKNYGEHHQGALAIHFELPFPLDDQRELRSTNGHAFVSSDQRFLFLYDACALIRVDLVSREVAHLLPPQDWYFHGITEQDGVLHVKLYDSANVHKNISPRTNDACFLGGMGPVTHGRFPSAFPESP